MKRYDCQNWFAKHYPEKYLPRSACTFCPYKNNNEWRHLQINVRNYEASIEKLNEMIKEKGDK